MNRFPKSPMADKRLISSVEMSDMNSLSPKTLALALAVMPTLQVRVCFGQAASERRRNNKDFHLKARARIQSWLSYMCLTRSTVEGIGPPTTDPALRYRRTAASERSGKNLKDCKDFRLENGSSQGRCLGLDWHVCSRFDQQRWLVLL